MDNRSKALFYGMVVISLCLETTCCAPASQKHTLLKLLGARENCVSTDPSLIKFYLYNRIGGEDSREEIILNDDSSLEKSGYLSGLPLKLLIHGFVEANFEPSFFPENVKDSYLKDQDENVKKNVLVVDMGTLSKPSFSAQLNGRDYFSCYLQAILNTNIIGSRITDMIEFLIRNKKTTPSLIHIIGDNLGVHIGGFVGNETTRRFNSKISRLTGSANLEAIDTAIPGFRPNLVEAARPMSTDDAEFVDAVNTINQLAFGDSDSIGHVDFFVNFFLQHADVGAIGEGDSRTGGFQQAIPLGANVRFGVLMDENFPAIIHQIRTISVPLESPRLIKYIPGPFIDSFASFYFAKSIGRSDIVGSNMNTGENTTFGENCKPQTIGVFFVCFSMIDNRPCLFHDTAEASEEMPGKSLVKGLSSSSPSN